MVINSRFNEWVCLITLDGGSGGGNLRKNPSYGAYVSGGTPTPAPAPSPVTPPPYGNNGASSAPSTLTSVGNTVGATTPSYGANAGIILNGGANAGVNVGIGSGPNAGAGVNTGTGTGSDTDSKPDTGTSGTGSDTDSKPDTGTSGTGSGVMSYDSYLAFINSQRQSGLTMAEGERNASYAAAAKYRAEAERFAEIERKRGVVDARSSYEQNKATYGANAEAMGRMGLTGSGYSDYLNSRAYAVQRSETQTANANAEASKREARYTEEQSRLQANKTYYDRKYQIDTTYQTNMQAAYQAKLAEDNAAVEKEQSDYETLLGYAMSGTYTKEQLAQFAKDKNLSEEHTASVLSAADDYTTKVNTETETVKNETEKNQRYNDWMKLIEVGGISDAQKAEIADAHANGDITVSEMNMLKAVYSMGVVPSFANGSGTGYMTYDEALETMNNIKNDPLASTELIKKVQKEFDRLYKNAAIADIAGSAVKFSDQVGDQKDYMPGDAFEVKYGNTTTYSVESDGFVTDTRILANAKGIANDVVFAVDGKLYMKKKILIRKSDGLVYNEDAVIELRPDARDYEDVLAIFQ